MAEEARLRATVEEHEMVCRIAITRVMESSIRVLNGLVLVGVRSKNWGKKPYKSSDAIDGGSIVVLGRIWKE